MIVIHLLWQHNLGVYVVYVADNSKIYLKYYSKNIFVRIQKYNIKKVEQDGNKKIKIMRKNIRRYTQKWEVRRRKTKIQETKKNIIYL